MLLCETNPKSDFHRLHNRTFSFYFLVLFKEEIQAQPSVTSAPLPQMHTSDARIQLCNNCLMATLRQEKNTEFFHWGSPTHSTFKQVIEDSGLTRNAVKREFFWFQREEILLDPKETTVASLAGSKANTSTCLVLNKGTRGGMRVH